MLQPTWAIYISFLTTVLIVVAVVVGGGGMCVHERRRRWAFYLRRPEDNWVLWVEDAEEPDLRGLVSFNGCYFEFLGVLRCHWAFYFWQTEDNWVLRLKKLLGFRCRDGMPEH